MARVQVADSHTLRITTPFARCRCDFHSRNERLESVSQYIFSIFNLGGVLCPKYVLKKRFHGKKINEVKHIFPDYLLIWHFVLL